MPVDTGLSLISRRRLHSPEPDFLASAIMLMHQGIPTLSARRLVDSATPVRVWVPPMSDVTRVLSAIQQRDSRASEQLLPLVYDALRKLAAQKLAREKPGQTLDATALVHEVYLRLVGVGGEGPHWDNRRHFFAAAAEAMRRILADLLAPFSPIRIVFTDAAALFGSTRD